MSNQLLGAIVITFAFAYSIATTIHHGNNWTPASTGEWVTDGIAALLMVAGLILYRL